MSCVQKSVEFAMSEYEPETSVPKQWDKNIPHRQARTLACFDQLPESALIDFNTTSMVLNRSLASLWRDVKAGRLPPPIYVGPKSPRFTVSTVRAMMKHGVLDLG
jgi:predicted DNA-binding transcriptional regulator AlpA